MLAAVVVEHDDAIPDIFVERSSDWITRIQVESGLQVYTAEKRDIPKG